MRIKTVEELIDKLNEVFDKNFDIECCDPNIFYNDFYEEGYSFFVEEHDTYGGEGLGDEYWIVFRVGNNETFEEYFIRFNGQYDSWNGTSWECQPELVTPQEKIINIWIPE